MRGCKLETCIQNAPLGSRSVAVRLAAEFPNLTLKHWACLGPCQDCVHVPFVLVNDSDYISAEHPQALHERVRAYLQKSD